MSDRQTAEAVGDVLVLRPAHEHLKLEAADAIAQLLARPAYQSVKKICVVLNAVNYVDSTGISLLVRIGSERRLRLCALSTKVRRVLEAMDLAALFDIDETESDSIVAFANL